MAEGQPGPTAEQSKPRGSLQGKGEELLPRSLSPANMVHTKAVRCELTHSYQSSQFCHCEVTTQQPLGNLSSPP